MIDISKYKKKKKKQIPARISDEVIDLARKNAKHLKISLTDYISEAISVMNSTFAKHKKENL